jgi:hypothetical protein
MYSATSLIYFIGKIKEERKKIFIVHCHHRVMCVVNHDKKQISNASGESFFIESENSSCERN